MSKSSRKRRGMPSGQSIREHWADILWNVKGYEGKQEFLLENVCFACGMNFNDAVLDRAHIYPHGLGGPNIVENLHLLCWVCHKSSEGLEATAYWSWLLDRTCVDVWLELAARNGVSMHNFIALQVQAAAVNGGLSFFGKKEKPKYTPKLLSVIKEHTKLVEYLKQRASLQKELYEGTLKLEGHAILDEEYFEEL